MRGIPGICWEFDVRKARTSSRARALSRSRARAPSHPRTRAPFLPKLPAAHLYAPMCALLCVQYGALRTAYEKTEERTGSGGKTNAAISAEAKLERDWGYPGEDGRLLRELHQFYCDVANPSHRSRKRTPEQLAEANASIAPSELGGVSGRIGPGASTHARKAKGDGAFDSPSAATPPGAATPGVAAAAGVAAATGAAAATGTRSAPSPGPASATPDGRPGTPSPTLNQSLSQALAMLPNVLSTTNQLCTVQLPQMMSLGTQLANQSAQTGQLISMLIQQRLMQPGATPGMQPGATPGMPPPAPFEPPPPGAAMPGVPPTMPPMMPPPPPFGPPPSGAAMPGMPPLAPATMAPATAPAPAAQQ